MEASIRCFLFGGLGGVSSSQFLKCCATTGLKAFYRKLLSFTKTAALKTKHVVQYSTTTLVGQKSPLDHLGLETSAWDSGAQNDSTSWQDIVSVNMCPEEAGEKDTGDKPQCCVSRRTDTGFEVWMHMGLLNKHGAKNNGTYLGKLMKRWSPCLQQLTRKRWKPTFPLLKFP